jgi:hypothetical protein
LNRFIFKVQNAKKNFGGVWKRIPGGYSTVSTKTARRETKQKAEAMLATL